MEKARSVLNSTSRFADCIGKLRCPSLKNLLPLYATAPPAVPAVECFQKQGLEIRTDF